MGVIEEKLQSSTHTDWVETVNKMGVMNFKVSFWLRNNLPPELDNFVVTVQRFNHWYIRGPLANTLTTRAICWRSKDELVSDVLLWTPTYGQAKAGRPAWTYIQQLCEDTGCNPEDLPEAMNDREKWREMVKDIRAGGITW